MFSSGLAGEATSYFSFTRYYMGKYAFSQTRFYLWEHVVLGDFYPLFWKPIRINNIIVFLSVFSGVEETGLLYMYWDLLQNEYVK